MKLAWDMKLVTIFCYIVLNILQYSLWLWAKRTTTLKNVSDCSTDVACELKLLQLQRYYAGDGKSYK